LAGNRPLSRRQAQERDGKEAFVSQKKVSEQELKIQIRWLIRRDMHDVLTIERASFDHPWTEEDFLCCLRQRNCIGMVAEHDHRIIGFMIYELHKSKLRVLNFATIPDMRRQGVGAQMIRRLVDKLSQQRRSEIMMQYRLAGVQEEWLLPFSPSNRISEFDAA
jgi:ribosomal-protein-alanine N-acetyltransferase